MRVAYVVDEPNWVQAARREHLERHVPALRLDLMTPSAYVRRRRWLRMRRPVYFASWRIVRGLGLRAEELGNSMASVTSHYNLGGGLAPETALPKGSDPATEFAAAVTTLRACKVVTVNSVRLAELLEPQVPNLVYAPNGVDTERFRPPAERAYGGPLRIGWVGKVKAAKNFEVVEAAAASLAGEGVEFDLVAHDKEGGDRLLTPDELREFYGRLDFYLCTSWHEGTPNPALEAAACGVPPVTTRVGNMPELVRDGENGFFVDPTTESVVAKLRELKRLGEAERRRLATTVRADIDAEWTWKRAAPRYSEAFARLAEAASSESPPS